MDSTAKVNIITFNCKNVKRSLNCVRTLCKTADIILLQETWLYPHDLSFLGNIHEEFSYTGKSSVDTSAGICKGRPYGGLAILWRKSAFNYVSVVKIQSNRICAVKILVSNRSFMVINMYMPTDCNENLPMFTQCLGEMYSLITNCNIETVFVLGDFNAHPGESFCDELIGFCTEQELIFADIEYLGALSQTYTFISDSHGCKRWLDHCLVTQSASNAILDIEIIYDSFWSDHFPLKIMCDINVIREKRCDIKVACNGIRWGERNINEINKYLDLCNSELKNLDFLNDFELCADKFCDKLHHKSLLDKMYKKIVNILSNAACNSKVPGGIIGKNRGIKGWNKHVKEFHKQARIKFKLWMWYGQPSCGPIFEDMRIARKIFKSRLKWCIKNQEKIEMDILASLHSKKSFSSFWKSTKKFDKSPSLPVSVEGESDYIGIANIFKDHFKVISPLKTASLRNGAEFCQSGLPVHFTCKEIKTVIKGMKRGKSPGKDGLSIEHLQNSGVHLPRVLTMLFNLFVGHSHLPREMLDTIVVPIVKNRTGDIADKGNYRPISLATVIAKVFDSVLDSYLSGYTKLHDTQFGFCAGLSTESAIFALKHAVKYYTDRKTPVYACFLDL